MKNLLVIGAAGFALAVGVPAALAATGTPETAPAQTTPQQEQPQQERPDRDDCPEKDRDAAAPAAGEEI